MDTVYNHFIGILTKFFTQLSVKLPNEPFFRSALGKIGLASLTLEGKEKIVRMFNDKIKPYSKHVDDLNINLFEDKTLSTAEIDEIFPIRKYWEEFTPELKKGVLTYLKQLKAISTLACNVPTSALPGMDKLLKDKDFVDTLNKKGVAAIADPKIQKKLNDNFGNLGETAVTPKEEDIESVRKMMEDFKVKTNNKKKL